MKKSLTTVISVAVALIFLSSLYIDPTLGVIYSESWDDDHGLCGWVYAYISGYFTPQTGWYGISHDHDSWHVCGYVETDSSDNPWNPYTETTLFIGELEDARAYATI